MWGCGEVSKNWLQHWGQQASDEQESLTVTLTPDLLAQATAAKKAASIQGAKISIDANVQVPQQQGREHQPGEPFLPLSQERCSGGDRSGFGEKAV